MRLALAGVVTGLLVGHGAAAVPAGGEDKLAVRLPTADSRYGPWLLGPGPVENERYIRKLKDREVAAAAMTVAYPILSGSEKRHDVYKRFYAYVFGQMAVAGMSPIVVVTPQQRDREYLRGQGAAGQCTGANTERLVAHAVSVARLLPEDTQIVLDYRPTVLSRAEGCADLASPEQAAGLVAGIVEALRASGFTGSIAASADLAALDHVDRLAEVPDLAVISANTLDARVNTRDALESRWATFRTRVEDAGRVAAVDALWLAKTDPAMGCESGSLTDAAVASKALDERATAALNGAAFTVIYETDLWLGAYLEPGEFVCAPDFGLKNRRLVQLKSRNIRRTP